MDGLMITIVKLFFFKQKTAYEMRTSDWSSDVCSSDLISHISYSFNTIIRLCNNNYDGQRRFERLSGGACKASEKSTASGAKHDSQGDRRRSAFCFKRQPRSEEHTSELKSLMRNSYAVFCLKKKTHY